MKGPTSIGLAKLYNDSDSDLTTIKYNYNIYGAADEITAGLSKGELDIAAVPCNLASVLYNKTEGEILIAGINTLGVLYVVTKNCDINSVSDLKGKTIFSTGQGTTPEYSFNYIVSENGLDPEKDMTVQYYSEATEIAAAFAAMDEVVAVLPEPFVTSVLNSNPDAKVSLSLTDEWEDINYESAFVTGVIVVRKEFADNNPQVVNDFLAEYKVSVEFANKNVEGCATLLEEFDIMKAAVAKKAIPNCNVVLITGKEMKEKVTSYLEVLYAANPQSVGGKLPDQSIFYNK
jgi:NitT/TauT family transport system substrate-binding protein